MATFEQLPRELRDLIYGYAVDEYPVYFAGALGESRLTSGRESRGLSLASKEIHVEYNEAMLRKATVVLRLDKHDLDKPYEPIPALLSRRIKQLTVIINLDGLKQRDWKPIDGSTALGPFLLSALERIKAALESFPNLEKVELQWWNDLSVAADRENVAEWTGELIKSGLVKTQELWFGYLGGKLSDPVQLRSHLLQQERTRRQTTWRPASKNGLDLLNNPLPDGLKTVSISPLSFF